jgi:hypothetical protein
MTRGNTPASCFFCWGVVLGAKAFASFSNSALVITVLQSPEDVFSEAAFAPAVVAVFAAVALGCAGQTPLIVNTGALAGTEADVSAGGFASFSA